MKQTQDGKEELRVTVSQVVYWGETPRAGGPKGSLGGSSPWRHQVLDSWEWGRSAF